MSQLDRLIPQGKNILCERLSMKETLEGGKIVIPDNARIRGNVQWLVVIKLGPEVTKDRFKKGDRIICENFSAAQLDDGHIAGFVHEDKIVGVLPGE